MKNTRLLIPFLLLFITACVNNNKTNNENIGKIENKTEITKTDVIILKKDVFYKELISNGILNAVQKAELRFKTGGELQNIKVHNGTYIQKNKVIARLNTDLANQNLEIAKLNTDKTNILFKQILTGHGFSPNKTDSVPVDILKTAKINSGYSMAKINYKKAYDNLKNKTLKAPFSGITANIKKKVFEGISPSEIFCTLINNNYFYVEFLVLENELEQVKIGNNVEATPFSIKKRYKGKITEINPIVDNNGMIKVKALIKNTDNKLIEGMNVEIKIKQAYKCQFIVPKQAVVIRDNLKIIFKYTNGKAYWIYVNIIDENSTYYSIEANAERNAILNYGDTIVVSDNLNLAHETDIKIKRILEN